MLFYMQKCFNIETNPQCNAEIVLHLVWSAMEKKHLNAQNANKVLYYKRQPAKLNVVFNE